jgi:hypothetical protein
MGWFFGKYDPDTVEKQDDYRLRDAKHAVEVKQPKDQARIRTGRERDHVEKVGKIRDHELGAQKNGLGGGSVVRRVR